MAETIQQVDVATGETIMRPATIQEQAQRVADTVAGEQARTARARADADRDAARALVMQVAQSAVGVRFDQLTAAQLRALCAIIFWQAGALDGSGVVQPLATWVR